MKFYTTLFPPVAALCILCSGCAKVEPAAEIRIENAETDMEDLLSFDETVDDLLDEPLTLEDVLRIVLCRNLDLLAQEYELAVQEETARAEHLRMLPPLTIDGVYQVRTKNTAALAKILSSPLQPTQAQLSSTKETHQFDIRDTLNLIDFGLAYFKTKQEKYRSLIIDQQHLRFRQKLIFDTIEAYWRAIAAQKLLAETQDIMERSRRLQQSLHKMTDLRVISKVQGLEAESKMYDAELQIYVVKHQYDVAKEELSAFMGLLPGTLYELADIDLTVENIDLGNIALLEEQALASRPELAVKDQEERIARESVRMAILQMFPNASMFEDYNGDGNPFLIYHYWFSAGIRATWNLFNIPLQWHYKSAARFQEEQARQTRLALSIAVLSQVHLAHLGYIDALNFYKLTKENFEVKDNLAKAAAEELRIGEFSGVVALDFASEAIISRITTLRAYANLQIAIEQINYAVGIPLWIGQTNLSDIYEEGYCE